MEQTSVMDQQERTHWPKLLLGAALALVLGLGTHVVMITYLHIPYPDDPPRTGVLLFCNRVLIVLAALLLYERSELARSSLAIHWKVLLSFVLFTTMVELLLRAPLMDGFVTTAWVYSFLTEVPSLARYLVLACLVVLVGVRCRAFWQKILFAIIGAAVVYLVVGPLATAAYAPVLTKFAYLSHDEVYSFPYGWQVTSMAFVTYTEPVAACLVAAALTWEQLPGSPLRRLLYFTLLVTMLRGSVLSLVAYAAKHADRFWPALASSGQFSAESVVLGLLTGATWLLARPKRT